MREKPEWIGFASANPVLWVLFWVLLVASMCCCSCSLGTCYHSRVSIRRQYAREASSQQNEEDNIEMAGANSENVSDDNVGGTPVRFGMKLWHCYWRFLVKCIWYGYYLSWLGWFVLIMTVGIFGFLLVMFSPKTPLTSICYDAVDWSGIVKNINVFYGSKYYADYEILLSLYNPNRVDLNVTSMRGQVHFPARTHNQREVGTVTLNDFFATAGSITDTLGILSFSMDRWNALNLSTSYLSGNLEISIDLSLGFEVRTHKVPLSWSSSLQMDRMIVNVNDPVDYTYCKCKGV